MTDLFEGSDGLHRCRWCGGAPEFLNYHDQEWGFPVSDDIRLFEKICLEAFQAGLSWRTILAKREHFRQAFLGFDFNKVARFGPADVDRLMQNEGIVRHRGKIEAVINNAICAQELIVEAGSLAAFFWSMDFESAYPPEPQTVSVTPSSIALSKALKLRGWKFVGPTTMYAFMQAMGLVNDHARFCALRPRADQARSVFKRPIG
jgi:DNA-3-methyladenine glycosylase I